MWVAGKPLKVKVADDRYEDRKIGDPVPEAPSWSFRVFESHKSLGWIRWVDRKPTQSVKRRRRRKAADVVNKG
jgi:hypothetical protein